MIFTYITTVANIGWRVEKRKFRLTDCQSLHPTTKKFIAAPSVRLLTSCLNLGFAHGGRQRLVPAPWCRRTPTAPKPGGLGSVSLTVASIRRLDADCCHPLRDGFPLSKWRDAFGMSALVGFRGGIGERGFSQNSNQKVEALSFD